MYLVDTDVLSELRKPAHIGSHSAREWIAAKDADDLFISVITVMEIAVGIARLRRRDSDQAERIQAWLDDQVLDAFAGRVIPIGIAEAERTALLHVPDPRPSQDALIAGTALVHNLTVVTRNVAHFEPMGVRVVNPFSE
jgi:predicted nucleic acid-binding protein